LAMTRPEDNNALLMPGILDITGVDGVPDGGYFGPLTCVTCYGEFDDALRLANHTRFGLAVGLVSPDRALFDRLLMEARA
ncbi:aldehyde dehydrogenase family protein, partial [Klebsiella pneumoniae]|uniref:aldehyde dehydrogenase family protein n=1 Tax=Klebsiella pneumoniae TaxID=573 RepID=UPI001BE0DE68